MSVLLSDQLKATRALLQRRSAVGLFLLPCTLAILIRRFNTLVALAEEQEAELRLTLVTAKDLEDGEGAKILRFPRRLVLITSAINEREQS